MTQNRGKSPGKLLALRAAFCCSGSTQTSSSLPHAPCDRERMVLLLRIVAAAAFIFQNAYALPSSSPHQFAGSQTVHSITTRTQNVGNPNLHGLSRSCGVPTSYDANRASSGSALDHPQNKCRVETLRGGGRDDTAGKDAKNKSSKDGQPAQGKGPRPSLAPMIFVGWLYFMSVALAVPALPRLVNNIMGGKDTVSSKSQMALASLLV